MPCLENAPLNQHPNNEADPLVKAVCAAVEVVEHHILVDKLRLYGFDDHAQQWIKDYFLGRSQSVYKAGCLSYFLLVNSYRLTAY